jgi:trans-2-enoyl-CoA reductase
LFYTKTLTLDEKQLEKTAYHLFERLFLQENLTEEEIIKQIERIVIEKLYENDAEEYIIINEEEEYRILNYKEMALLILEKITKIYNSEYLKELQVESYYENEDN